MEGAANLVSHKSHLPHFLSLGVAIAPQVRSLPAVLHRAVAEKRSNELMQFPCSC